MKIKSPRRRAAGVVVATTVVCLIAPALAGAHARISPAVSLAGKLQLYSLAVPTEKSAASTTRVVLTVPAGFGIDSFVPPPPGWTQHIQQTGTGDSAVVTKVTWAGGHTPTGQDSLFQFLAQPSSPQTYTFQVQQTYSDGSIVNWTGAENSAAPAPTIQAQSSLGGGGVSIVSIVALVIGGLGLLAGGAALAGRTGSGRERPLV